MRRSVCFVDIPAVVVAAVGVRLLTFWLGVSVCELVCLYSAEIIAA